MSLADDAVRGFPRDTSVPVREAEPVRTLADLVRMPVTPSPWLPEGTFLIAPSVTFYDDDDVDHLFPRVEPDYGAMLNNPASAFIINVVD